jgi:CrcB protein
MGNLPGWAWVAIGGALGSLLRYGVGWILFPWAAAFPWGTFTANVTGTFLIGVFTSLLGGPVHFHPHWRLFLATGLCGGYTTLSSLMLETDRIARSGRWLAAGGYLGSTLFCSALALLAGMALFRK